MSSFLRLCLVCACFFALSRTAMAAEPPKPVDLVLVIFVGENPGEIETEDVTNPLGFVLDQMPDTNFQDQIRANQFLADYQSNTSPGSCVFDVACLRKVRQEKNLRHFFVIMINFRADNQAEVAIQKVTDSIMTDVDVRKVIPASVASLINLSKAVITESLQAPATVPKPEPEPVIKIEPLPVKLVVKIPSPEPHPPLLPPNLITDSPGSRPGRSLIITGWTLVGVGAVLAGVGTYYGVRASDIESDLNENCGPGTLCVYNSNEASDMSDDMKTSGLLFNSLGIPGWVMVAGGLATAISGHVLATETSGVVEISPILTPDSAMLFSTVHF